MKILFISNQRKYKDPEGGFIRKKSKGNSLLWNFELFREELFKRTDTVCSGWGYNTEWKKTDTLSETIKKFGRPDVILSHIDTVRFKDYNKIKDVLKVHIAGDYYAGHPKLLQLNSVLQYYNYDIVFGYSNSVVVQLYKDQIGKKHCLLPFGVTPDIFCNLKIEKKYDVAAFFTVAFDETPLRHKIQDMIQMMDISTWTKPSWLNNAVLKINQAKICINSNAKYKFVNPRVTEVLSCGTFLLTDRTEELEKFGYIDKQHLVMFNDLNDLKEKIYYYLEHEEEREKIAQQGMEFVRTNYTNEKMVRRLLEIIQNELAKKN